ncbi:MAG: T9SS type A sorting domain-containing protein [Candidatus Sabulitectum sp.]|nr:T9SS type A sorting domain-containing protein [Candidatus Sabulitectum sp.]
MFKFITILVIVSVSFAGHLVGWGSDNYGQVSNIPTGEDFIQASCGSCHAIALRSDSTLVAWGNNGSGQGVVPADLEDETFIFIAAGAGHNVAIKADSTLVAWGLNDDSQCDCPTGKFIDIAAGVKHSVGLRSDGSIVTWGYTFGDPDPIGYLWISVTSSRYRCAALRWLNNNTSVFITWGTDDDGILYPLGYFGEFIEIADGECASAIDSISPGVSYIREWDYESNQWVNNGQPNQPGDYHGLTRSETHGFAIEDGELIGWGDNEYGALDIEGLNAGYLSINAGHHFSIGIQETGTGIAGSPEPTLNLSVLANPSASPMIQFTTDTAVELSIYDISGRTVSNESYGPGDHSVSPMLSTGIYLVRLEAVNQELLARLVAL